MMAAALTGRPAADRGHFLDHLDGPARGQILHKIFLSSLHSLYDLIIMDVVVSFQLMDFYIFS